MLLKPNLGQIFGADFNSPWGLNSTHFQLSQLTLLSILAYLKRKLIYKLAF